MGKKEVMTSKLVDSTTKVDTPGKSPGTKNVALKDAERVRFCLVD